MARKKKRERRYFTDAFKRDAVEHFEKSGKTRAAFARSLDIDESVLLKWVRKVRGGASEPRAGKIKREAVREAGDHPHAERVAAWLALRPRTIRGVDWEDLRASVSEAVADMLDETNVDGGELLAELANQGYRVSEIWPPPEKGVRYTLKLFDPVLTTQQMGQRKHYRLINPWGRHV